MKLEAFDPAAFAEAMAPLLGLDVAQCRREPVLLNLTVAAEHAAKLLAHPLDDEAEPAPVFAP